MTKTMTNAELWIEVEAMVESYANLTDAFEKEIVFGEIFETMQGYLRTSINNAFKNAKEYGLHIPKEDFESRFFQALWESVEAFEIGGSKFKNIVIRRFQFAETGTWRQYKRKGNDKDVNGITYDSARWDSLDRKIGGESSEGERTLADVAFGDEKSTEDTFFDSYDVELLLNEFKATNERYANVIAHMALGMTGDDLAIATGESDSNDAKMRKLVQRSKQAFEKFLNERN